MSQKIIFPHLEEWASGIRDDEFVRAMNSASTTAWDAKGFLELMWFNVIDVPQNVPSQNYKEHRERRELDLDKALWNFVESRPGSNALLPY